MFVAVNATENKIRESEGASPHAGRFGVNDVLPKDGGMFLPHLCGQNSRDPTASLGSRTSAGLPRRLRDAGLAPEERVACGQRLGPRPRSERHGAPDGKSRGGNGTEASEKTVKKQLQRTPEQQPTLQDFYSFFSRSGLGRDAGRATGDCVSS